MNSPYFFSLYLTSANPPYSIKQWDRGAFENDKYGRNFLGTPPQGRADYAFFQHILKSLKPNSGRCAILFPHGVLFRDEENDMRKKLVESDLVECVIGIGKNLFFNSPMEACILICRTNKPLNRRGKVLFINAKKEVTRKNAQSYLEDEHIRKIASAYEDFSSVEGFSTVVPLNDIIAHDHKLSIPLYVRGSEEPEPELLPLEDAIVEWMDSSAALSENYAALIELLNGGDPNGKIQI